MPPDYPKGGLLRRIPKVLHGRDVRHNTGKPNDVSTAAVSGAPATTSTGWGLDGLIQSLSSAPATT